nr:hypothetical protein [Candidatus Freyarchaeota archaeon]
MKIVIDVPDGVTEEEIKELIRNYLKKKKFEEFYELGMSKQSIDVSAHMEGAPQSEQLSPVEREYTRCVTALNRTSILTLLPKSESIGVIW